MMKEYLPSDICEKIEEMLETLEYIRDWEPSDAEMIANNSCGTQTMIALDSIAPLHYR